MTTAQTAYQKITSEVLGEDVREWAHRMHWEERHSWRTIALGLSLRTGIRLRPETLRRWDYQYNSNRGWRTVRP
jgi:uncharacterized protein (DUF2236 family)